MWDGGTFFIFIENYMKCFPQHVFWELISQLFFTPRFSNYGLMYFPKGDRCTFTLLFLSKTTSFSACCKGLLIHCLLHDGFCSLGCKEDVVAWLCAASSWVVDRRLVSRCLRSRELSGAGAAFSHAFFGGRAAFHLASLGCWCFPPTFSDGVAFPPRSLEVVLGPFFFLPSLGR